MNTALKKVLIKPVWQAFVPTAETIKKCLQRVRQDCEFPRILAGLATGPPQKRRGKRFSAVDNLIILVYYKENGARMHVQYCEMLAQYCYYEVFLITIYCKTGIFCNYIMMAPNKSALLF